MIKNRLRIILAEKEISNNEVAKALGVHYQTVSLWVHNKEQPRPDNLQNLCNFLNISAQEFYQDNK
jgi:putative transcriptional regulator